MTLIYELDLKMYLRTKDELSKPRHSEFRAVQTDRQRDATEHISRPHSRVIISGRSR